MSDSEINGNVPVNKTLKSKSLEDVSEYTDADESISAPTEILSEFLSSIMLKDYETALKYCTLILNYEPNNKTAKEFYPLILEKLEIMQSEDCDDGSSDSSNSSVTSESLSSSDLDEGNKITDGTTASYSSLVDDEVNPENDGADLENLDLDNGNKVDCLPPEDKIEKPTDEKGSQRLYPVLPNILIHPSPTRTITRDCPRADQETEINKPNEKEHKMRATATQILIHSTATTTFPKTSDMPMTKNPRTPTKSVNKQVARKPTGNKPDNKTSSRLSKTVSPTDSKLRQVQAGQQPKMGTAPHSPISKI